MSMFGAFMLIETALSLALLVIAANYVKSRLSRPLVQLCSQSRRYRAADVWTTRVFYDAWGMPYADETFLSFHVTIALYPDGKTGDYLLNGTEWKHIGGPKVTFPNDAALNREDITQ